MLATVSSIDTLISDEHLTETLCELVNTRSPTGEEASLAGQISARPRRYGVNADTQSFNKSQANAIGRIDGEGDKSLLLYAPLDTVTSDHAEEDLPWAGPELRDDMRACAFVEDGHVFGLGAHNPKGHAACILETARVLAVMDTKLAGNLFFGFGAGGMPTHSRPGLPEDTGHGVGCRHLVESLPPMDGAIIANSIALRDGCEVDADLYYRALELDEGALFEGKSRRHDNPMSLAPAAMPLPST